MKKIFMAICVAMASVGMAHAEAGDVSIGATLGVSPSLESHADWTAPSLGFKAQYSFTDAVRANAAFNYDFKTKGASAWDVTANVNYLIPIVSSFGIYPTMGVGLGQIGNSNAKFVFNIGLGAQYAFNSRWAATFDFKYQYMKHWSTFPLALGVMYTF